jgi:hypothetical protein
METEKKKKSKAGESLAKQLSAYSAAAGVVLLVSPQVHSAIQVTRPVTPLVVSANSPVSIDMDNDGVADFTVAKGSRACFTRTSYDTFICMQNIAIGEENAANRIQTAGGSLDKFAVRLNEGETVAAGGKGGLLMMTNTYTGNQSWYAYAYFNNGADGYIGVKFRGHDDKAYNGWIHFIGGADINNVTGAIESWAYEDSGKPIKAGYEVDKGDPPIADAGPDQRVLPGDRVILRGDNSTDVNGGPLTFKWTQESGPKVKLTNASKGNVTFTAPKVGRNGRSLVFQLKVADSTRKTSINRCIVNVSRQNVPPKAETGAEQNVSLGDRVTLDARGSHDPQGGGVEYHWKQNGNPGVVLSNPRAARPAFTAPKSVASLNFLLTVKDAGGLLSDDLAIVNVMHYLAKQPPVAKAGADQKRRAGTKVRLDGSGSTDPRNMITSYRWSQISGPPVKLSNPNAVKPAFIAPKVGRSGADLEFRLIVTSGRGLQSQDKCIVHVKP